MRSIKQSEYVTDNKVHVAHPCCPPEPCYQGCYSLVPAVDIQPPNSAMFTRMTRYVYTFFPRYYEFHVNLSFSSLVVILCLHFWHGFQYSNKVLANSYIIHIDMWCFRDISSCLLSGFHRAMVHILKHNWTTIVINSFFHKLRNLTVLIGMNTESYLLIIVRTLSGQRDSDIIYSHFALCCSNMMSSLWWNKSQLEEKSYSCSQKCEGCYPAPCTDKLSRILYPLAFSVFN